MILGLDVSTSIVGICLLNREGEFVKIWYVDLRKEKEFSEKVERYADSFGSDFDRSYDYSKYVVDHVFIEESLSGFAAGRTSQQTIIKLAMFNGACTYQAFCETGVYPIHIHPSTVKASMKHEGLVIPKGGDKKRLTLDFVRKAIEFPYVETRNGNPQPYCYDMADAYCVARAGYLKFCKETKS